MGEVLLALDAERVESAAQGKRFKGLAVDRREVDTLYKVEYIFIWSVLLALGYDVHRSCIAHSLDCRQSESYLAFLVGRELSLALVDVRTETRYAHCLTFGHELRYLRDVVDASAHVACHKFGRVVCLQIGCLICHP